MRLTFSGKDKTLKTVSYPKIFYTARSHNKKTGDIPTQWIGGDLGETKKTCSGCALLDKICYSINGTPGYFGFPAILRAAKKGFKKYTIMEALQGRNNHANFVRFGAIGDPSAIAKKLYTYHYNMIKKAGLQIISYTHFPWSRGSHLKGKALASCDTVDGAKLAVDAGWRTTVHLDNIEPLQGKVDGKYSYTVCPAQRGYKTLGKRNNQRINPAYNKRYEGITCNDCGLCVPERKGLDIVVFLNH